jgi:probable F420-dependent oxidoreductase
MQIGATFPQAEIGTDPAVAGDYAQAVEGLGFDHLAILDHVVGGPGASPGDSVAHVGIMEEANHEAFVLCGYLAAVTKTLAFETRILVLPQRQTAVVAKQTAEVDLLSGGRMRLGVGLGWNEQEFAALGADFRARGRLVGEQIRLLRALWTQPVVTFEGKWHHVVNMGLNPLPVQRPIPLWMGGGSAGSQTERTFREPALRRIGQLADGWLVNGTWQVNAEAVERVHGYAREAGRQPGEVQLGPGLQLGRGNPDTWRESVEGWKALGAEHFTLNTLNGGFKTPAEHLARLELFRRECL